MKPRLNPYKAAPGVYKAMMDLQTRVNNSGLEKSLQELVKTRASQINGCAYCLYMHTRDARAAGETEERLFVLVRGASRRFTTSASGRHLPSPRH